MILCLTDPQLCCRCQSQLLLLYAYLVHGNAECWLQHTAHEQTGEGMLSMLDVVYTVAQ